MLKKWFAVYGQLQQVFSDNGPQYSSMELKKFSQEWNFEHLTSSPKGSTNCKENPEKMQDRWFRHTIGNFDAAQYTTG
jgi:hypothetical protein